MGGRLTICEVPGLLCGSQDKLKALAGTYPPESTPSQVMCVPHRQVCMWSVCVCVHMHTGSSSSRGSVTKPWRVRPIVPSFL